MCICVVVLVASGCRDGCGLGFSFRGSPGLYSDYSHERRQEGWRNSGSAGACGGTEALSHWRKATLDYFLLASVGLQVRQFLPVTRCGMSTRQPAEKISRSHRGLGGEHGAPPSTFPPTPPTENNNNIASSDVMVSVKLLSSTLSPRRLSDNSDIAPPPHGPTRAPHRTQLPLRTILTPRRSLWLPRHGD